jgi:hypothetical protein
VNAQISTPTLLVRCRNLYAFDGKCNFTAPSGRVLCVGNIELNRDRGPAVRFPSSRRFRDFITKAAGRRFDSHRAADSATSAYFFLLLSPSSSLLLPLSLSPSFLVFRVGGMVKNQAASHCGWGDMSAACDALNSPAATRSFRCRNLCL